MVNGIPLLGRRSNLYVCTLKSPVLFYTKNLIENILHIIVLYFSERVMACCLQKAERKSAACDPNVQFFFSAGLNAMHLPMKFDVDIFYSFRNIQNENCKYPDKHNGLYDHILTEWC